MAEFTTPSIVFSHPTGNEFVREASRSMAQNEMLHEFNTSVGVFPDELLFKLGGLSVFKDLRRRSFDDLLKKYTCRYPLYEAGRLLAPKIGLGRLTDHENGVFCVDNVYQQLDMKVASKLPDERIDGATAVYAYEDGALSTFKEAGRQGLNCFYDLPIGYWRAKRLLLSRAKDQRPKWSQTMSGFRDSDAKLARKDQELAMADHIFVASSFTAKTLDEYPGDLGPVHVIPYGFPEVQSHREYKPLLNRKLKVLYVGSLTERKGVAELFEAVDQLKDSVELTVVGKKPVENCEILNRNLEKHRYIPSLPHDEVLKLMREQDLFLFPSLFEGFGLVITEAMSQGTPVITTDRTAGPDIITDGQDGWIIPAGSSGAIIQKLEEILSHPRVLKSAGQAAMMTAKKRPWNMYGQELANKIIQISNDKTN